MDNNQPPRIFDEAAEFHSEGTTSLSKNFVANVFSWMVVGLVVTSVVAWYGASTGLYANLMLSGGIMPWVLMLSPFAFIIAMNAGLEKFSATTLTMMFLAFSACMGLSLSSVFLVYELGSVFQVFAITAGTFTVMAIAGYTTSIDLTRMGSLLFMGLIGIILASVVNWFMGSETIEFIVSILGVLISKDRIFWNLCYKAVYLFHKRWIIEQCTYLLCSKSFLKEPKKLFKPIKLLSFGH